MTSVVKRYRRTVRSGSDDAENVRTIGALERSVDRVLDAVARVARGEESACAMSSSRACSRRQTSSGATRFEHTGDIRGGSGRVRESGGAFGAAGRVRRRERAREALGLNGACDFGEAAAAPARSWGKRSACYSASSGN